MKRILVGMEDKLALFQLDRVLKTKQVSYDLAQGLVSKETVLRYDVLIVHPSWRLPSLFVFVENLVLSEQVIVLFIQPSMSSNSLSRVQESAYLVRINELKQESELPLALELSMKFMTEKKRLFKQLHIAQNKLTQQEKIVECKFLLVDKGMTEEEAHRYIIKVAMDHQMTKYAACLKILSEFKT